MKCIEGEPDHPTKESHIGIKARVRSRWRSIFSKKNSVVKLRDYNRISIDSRFILPESEHPLVGTIVAQATVEPVPLPDGEGVALIQETQHFSESKIILSPEEPIIRNLCEPSPKILTRFSSGDITMLHQMFEEIPDIKEFSFDGMTFTEQTDKATGIVTACLKPGPNCELDHQKLFLKQCLDDVENRPRNLTYTATGWALEDFESMMKHMLRRPDSPRTSFLRIEFSECIPSLKYLCEFISGYAKLRGFNVKKNYVYATIHSKKLSQQKKLRGLMEPFLEVEEKVLRTKMSYITDLSLSSAKLPNVMIVLRYYHLRSPKEKEENVFQTTLQVEQITGYNPMICKKVQLCDNSFDETLQFDDDDQKVAEMEMKNAKRRKNGIDETDGVINGKEDEKPYSEMFPILFELLGKTEMLNEETYSESESELESFDTDGNNSDCSDNTETSESDTDE
ncbi:unnamed protein product [Caenorhabditis bovis]|uniref:Uncharacterized protein n=1 Tax=Caenorhabditis bovis TaxID=2654633 RepID=A0A8S1F7W1_9PELO|nr:unnamed protein product [Caenorhabditis bovis]